MKLTLTLSIIAIMLCPMVMAQTSGGPDAYGYTWVNSIDANGPTYNWIDITGIGTQVSGLGDDNFVGPFPIGFTFDYYWTNPTNFFIGSNGYITFDVGHQISSGGTLAFPNLPSAVGGHNFLAPFLSDINFDNVGNPGTCYYYSNNTDTLIVSFIDVPFWNNASNFAGSNTFQVIISAVDNSITYQYQTQMGLYDAAYNGTTNPIVIGMENINGTIGLQVSNQLPTPPLAILFEYPDTVTFSVTDVQPNWLNNEKNYGFMGLVGTPMVIEASVSNVGNVGIGSAFDVTTELSFQLAGVPVGVPFYDQSFNIGGMTQGQTINYSYGPLYTPTMPGNFVGETTTMLAGDLINSNNTVFTELVVYDTTGLSEITLSFTDGMGEAIFGFEGGAVYYDAPFYPAEITSVAFALVDQDTLATPSDQFSAKIFDDDGPNGGPGTLLYDSVVASNDVVTINAAGQLHVLFLDQPVEIMDGGFYVSWESQAVNQNTNLLVDQTGPFSRRTFEVLSGTFGPYRDAAIADLFIFANISVPSADTATAPPVASFGASSSSVCEGGTIQFFNQTANASSINWTFDGGSPMNSTDQMPTVTYSNAGTYEVTLIVSNTAGDDTATQTITVQGLPTAGFTSSADTVEVGQFLGLTAISTDATANLWQFGDGLTGSGDMTFHAYADTGTYTIVLEAVNPCGSDFDTSIIVVIDTMEMDTVNTGFASVSAGNAMISAVYPNPANNILFVELSDQVESLIVLAIDGEEVLNRDLVHVNGYTHMIRIDGLSSGMYLLKALSDKGFESKTFIINR